MISLLAACVARHPIPVQKGWLQVGHLALPWPSTWKLLPKAPRALPQNVDGECDCTRLGASIHNDIPRDRYKQLGLIWTGEDTLVLDTIQAALWPGDGFEPCYGAYDSLMAVGGLEALLARHAALAAKFRRKTLYHRVLPSSDVHVVGAYEFQHFDGSGLRPGRSGIYYRGSPQQRPLGIYGIDLHRATIDTLWEMMKGLQIRE